MEVTLERERQIEMDRQIVANLQAAENEDERLRTGDDISRHSTLTDDGHTDREGLAQRTCVSCMDTTSESDTHRCPCGHHWCRSCVVSRFEMAVKNTYLFPAQCCDQPMLPDNHALVAPETWRRYFDKRDETEAPDPTFCSRLGCSKFVPPLQVGRDRQARCACGRVTCVDCKDEWHAGECSLDSGRRQVLSLARAKKWQICFHCKAIVDRRDGCNQVGMCDMITYYPRSCLGRPY